MASLRQPLAPPSLPLARAAELTEPVLGAFRHFETMLAGASADLQEAPPSQAELERVAELTRERSKDGDQIQWLLALAERIERHEAACEDIDAARASLAALTALHRGWSWEEINHRLAGDPWISRHEVLLRWGWLAEHHSLLDGGARLTAPFRCIVPERGRPERALDREFWTLRQFIRGLEREAGRQLLFREKGETPDFVVVEAASGERLGIEVGEAPQADPWSDEQDSIDALSHAIATAIAGKDIHVHLEEPIPSDKRSPSQLAAVVRAVLDAASHQAWGRRELEPGLWAEVEPGIEGVSSSDPRGHLRLDLEAASADLAGGLRQSSRSKLFKKGKPREPPSIRPCWLVLYPNADLIADRGRALEIVREQGWPDVRSHFDALWIVTEKGISRAEPPCSDLMVERAAAARQGGKSGTP